MQALLCLHGKDRPPCNEDPVIKRTLIADIDGVITGSIPALDPNEEGVEPALAELVQKGPQTEADVIMDILGPADYDETTPNPTEPLKVCLLNADTYGIKGMGGTATAYWLLAETLAKYTENGQKPFRVRVLAPSAPNLHECQALEKLYTTNNMELICIDPKGHDQKYKWTFYMPYLTQGAATLEWFRQSSKRECDVMHVHEWGGLAAPILQARLVMDSKLSARLPTYIGVESHGGHMWSGLSHSPRRPADLIALEVDYHEKFTLEQSDTTLSPSRYMLRCVLAKLDAFSFSKVSQWSAPVQTDTSTNVAGTRLTLARSRIFST